MCRALARDDSLVDVIDMSMQIPVTDIPEHGSIRLDLKATPEDLDVLFGDLDEYKAQDVSSFEAAVRLQRMGDTIRLAGDVWVNLDFECGRCLTPRVFEAHGQLEYLLVSRENYEASYHHQEDLELSLDDLDVDIFEGEDVALRPFLRESVLLALPNSPTCALTGDAQACDTAFAELARVSGQDDESQRNQIDPRWAPLMALKDKVNDKE